MHKENIIKKASSFEEAFFNCSTTYIHPTAIIGNNVKLGKNVKIGPFCIITGDVTIGDNTRLYSHVTVGLPAQNRGTMTSLGSVVIKNNCEIRQYVSIHASKYENGTTIVGNNCYIMNFCHVSHDVILEDNVTLINSVNLGGHTYIEHNAFLMANCATHQFCRVGAYSSLAPYSASGQDIPPYGLYFGLPAKFSKLNTVALKRAGFTTTTLENLKKVTRLFFQKKLLLDEIKTEALHQPWGNEPAVQKFLTFIEQSTRGVSRK